MKTKAEETDETPETNDQARKLGEVHKTHTAEDIRRIERNAGQMLTEWIEVAGTQVPVFNRKK